MGSLLKILLGERSSTPTTAKTIEASNMLANDIRAAAQNGQVFTLRFHKVDGMPRTMKAKLSKYGGPKAGGNLNYDPKEKGILVVWDTITNEYKSVRMYSVDTIDINGKRYKIKDLSKTPDTKADKPTPQDTPEPKDKDMGTDVDMPTMDTEPTIQPDDDVEIKLRDPEEEPEVSDVPDIDDTEDAPDSEDDSEDREEF